MLLNYAAPRKGFIHESLPQQESPLEKQKPNPNNKQQPRKQLFK